MKKRVYLALLIVLAVFCCLLNYYFALTIANAGMAFLAILPPSAVGILAAMGIARLTGPQK